MTRVRGTSREDHSYGRLDLEGWHASMGKQVTNLSEPTPAVPGLAHVESIEQVDQEISKEQTSRWSRLCIPYTQCPAVKYSGIIGSY
jgi:hypothetical protein